jgi:CRP-like cAMP-binding protein
LPEPATNEILDEVKLGIELSVPDKQRLVAISQLVTLPVGEVVFREGEKHAFVYWIVDGQIMLEMATGGTKAKSLLTLGRGDLVAWSAVLRGGRMQATATAVQPTQLLRIDGEQLNSLCQSNHEIGYRVMEHVARRLADRLQATRLQLLDLYRSPDEAAE